MTTRHYCFTLWINSNAEADLSRFRRDDGRSRKGLLGKRQRDDKQRGRVFGIDGTRWKEYIQRLGADERVRYVIAQRERCPNTGREHIQGYIQFTEPQRGTLITGILGLEGSDMWFKRAYGSPQDNIKYCTKDDSQIEPPVFSGEPSLTQGQRTDLDQVTDFIKDSHSIAEVAREYPKQFVKYHKGIERLIQLTTEQNFERIQKEVHVRWGKSRQGKSTWAYSHAKQEGGFYRVPAIANGSIWIDGYEGQKTVYFDDYGGEGGIYPLPTLLRILDHWECTLPVKGSFRNFAPNRILITSNIDPRQWYSNSNGEQVEALFKRFTSCIQVGTSIDGQQVNETVNTSNSSQSQGNKYILCGLVNKPRNDPAVIKHLINTYYPKHNKK
jgi:hypothetical protein